MNLDSLNSQENYKKVFLNPFFISEMESKIQLVSILKGELLKFEEEEFFQLL